MAYSAQFDLFFSIRIVISLEEYKKNSLVFFKFNENIFHEIEAFNQKIHQLIQWQMMGLFHVYTTFQNLKKKFGENQKATRFVAPSI